MPKERGEGGREAEYVCQVVLPVSHLVVFAERGCVEGDKGNESEPSEGLAFGRTPNTATYQELLHYNHSNAHIFINTFKEGVGRRDDTSVCEDCTDKMRLLCVWGGGGLA